jgi:hypothetical protein
MEYTEFEPGGKPQKLKDDFKMCKMGVRGWRKAARNRGAWRLILREARVLHGP